MDRIESPETEPHAVSGSLTKNQRQYNEAKTVFPTNGAKTTVYTHAKNKNESRYSPYPSEKLPQMDCIPQCKIQNCKTPRI